VINKRVGQKFSRDGRGVDIVLGGGRVKAHLDGDWLRGVIWDSLSETAFVVSLI
jgi:hypothetical protein